MLDKYFMKHTYTFFFTILFTGCSTYLLSDPTTEAATIEVNKNNPLIQANDYLGYHEDTHRAEIEEFTGVDPVYTQWCAAFVNAVLEESNLASLNTPGASHCQSCKENLPHPYPLTARSFLHYGIFSLPGAFTPTCSTYQLPGFEENYNKIKSFGVDEIYCMSVNDAFVMNAWAKAQCIERVKVIPDGSGNFTRFMGMLIGKNHLGFGLRSWRYMAIINDGVDDDPYVASTPENCITYLDNEEITID